MKNMIQIFLLIFILLNVCFFIELKKTRSSLETCTNNNVLLTKIIETQKLQFEYNGLKFTGRESIIDSLQTLINNRPKLFLSFNEISCESCVDLAMNDLKIIGQKIGIENIVILTKYTNKKEALYLSKRLGDKYKIFNIPSEKALIIDEYYFSLPPNFFIMGTDLKTNFFFIHSINFPSLNEGYFNSIENYFRKYI